jgi:DNA-binding MarR family transcriptional regulator
MTIADDSATRVLNALRRLVSALRSSDATASREWGMSVAQLFALRTIGRHPGLFMSELAERTLTTQSTVSEVVSRLVARDLVRRAQDASDHRRIRLYLTWEGEVLSGSVKRTVPEHLVAALETMGPGMRALLADAMEHWVISAGFAGVAPEMFGEGELPVLPAVAVRSVGDGA